MKPLTLNLLAAAIASACAMLPQPASAAHFPLLFSRDAAATDGIPAGEVREQMQGIAQVRLRGDATASFVGRARYRLREDGDVELHQGSVTVATGDAGAGSRGTDPVWSATDQPPRSSVGAATTPTGHRATGDR